METFGFFAFNLCAVIALLMSALLLRRRPFPIRLHLLGLFILCLSGMEWALFTTGGISGMTHLPLFLSRFQYLLPAMGLLVARSFLRRRESFSLSDLLHLLPALLVYFSGLPIEMHQRGHAHGVSHHVSDFLHADAFEGRRSFSHLGLLLVSLLMAGYAIAVFHELRVFKAAQERDALSGNRLLTRWLEFTAVSRSAVAVLLLSDVLVALVSGRQTILGAIYGVIIVAQVLIDFTYLLLHPSLLGDVAIALAEPEVTSKPPAMEVKVPQKGKADAVRAVMNGSLRQRVEEYLQEDVSLLGVDFTLKRMSDDIKASPASISRYIRETYDRSFPDHVNHLRLELLDRRIRVEPVFRSFSLEAMAREVGFRSKNAFYLAFRKLHGVAPGFYYRDIL